MENKVKDSVENLMLHRIYKLALDLQTSDTNKSMGLCNVFTDLRDMGKITTHEMFMVKKHFRTQRPTRTLHREFYESYIYDAFGTFWWKNYSSVFYATPDQERQATEEAKEQRTLFLKKMISETEPKYITPEVATSHKIRHYLKKPSRK
jgi:hypothetical protein